MPDSAKHRSRLEAILANAVDAIITIDERGIIDSANPASTALFGYSVDELIGNNVSMLMPSPYCEEHDGYLAQYLRGGPAKIIGVGREVVGRRKDGTIFPMHLAVSEFETDGLRMFTGIVRDISDLKMAEQQLRKLNDELEVLVRDRTAELHDAQAELLQKEKLATLGQVSGGIAHEIRNPLNAVKTSIYYLVHARNPTEEKTKEHLDRIDRQVTMIDNVVTALSDVAKLPDPIRTPIDIEQFVRQTVRSTTLSSDIDIDWEVDDALPKVLADANQLPIVFKNLIRNARDAMPNGGRLTFRLAANQSQVAVTVVDTGTGMPSSVLERVFEPLYSTKARGMGLGLAITKAILEKNKGSLQVQSQVGTGSEFTVALEAEGTQ